MKKNHKQIIVFSVLIFVILFTFINVKAAGMTSAESCSSYFGSVDDPKSLMYLLVNYVFRPIKFAVPILLVVLTTFDFAKVVFTDEKDAMEKAKKNFTRRALMGVVIFFVPYVLQLLFTLFDQAQYTSCLSHLQ